MVREYETAMITSRFSNRAENYQLYRPPYIPELLQFLEQEVGLKKTHHVADIGSGTGRFAELLLKNGYMVSGVEPDDDMRETAEKKLGSYQLFSSVAGSAEDTGLDDGSIDLVVAAHAFHWMDIEAVRHECNRILAPGGRVILLWTMRQKGNGFLDAYDNIKKQFRDRDVPPLVDEQAIRDFYSPASVSVRRFPHHVWMNFDALKGLLLSSSGVPLPGHRHYDTMISSLVQLFVNYNQNGFVKMEYETAVYY